MENEQKSSMQAKMQPKELMVLSSKKKWFWIGIAIGFFDTVSGLIYGIALYREPQYRSDAKKIIIFAIIRLIVAIVILYFLNAWLQSYGYIRPNQIYLPNARLLQ